MAAFPDDEYEQRLARTRVRMGEAGVDVLKPRLRQSTCEHLQVARGEEVGVAFVADP